MNTSLPNFVRSWTQCLGRRILPVLLIGLFVVAVCPVLAVKPAKLANDIPLVYPVEHTGAAYPKPVLPALEALPVVVPLTDPFMWSVTDPYQWKRASRARSTRFKDWSRRRAEIAWEIQHYEIGERPRVHPDSVTAVFDDGVLTVVVRHEGRLLTLSAKVQLPEGEGPFPAVIGMNMPGGSLPTEVFTSRRIALITYSHNQVTTYYRHSNDDPFYQLYPHLNVDNSGQYAAWSWGVSRLIDGLERCRERLPIDLNHLAVTGCSYAGKMALFAGAFDERIALTIAQEPGGGGAAAWRVSETLGKVETLSATNYDWFADGMRAFSGSNTSRLPFDHHELCAMVAPRALLMFGNPDYEWLADPSGQVSMMAAREVYKAFGIEDRCGYSIEGKHGHCRLPDSQHPELEAFVDRFLLGRDVDTHCTKSDLGNQDVTRWIGWWGTNNPVLPPATRSASSDEHHSLHNR